MKRFRNKPAPAAVNPQRTYQFLFPRQRHMFSGAGPLFDPTAEEKAAAAETALVEKVAAKVAETFKGQLDGMTTTLRKVTEAVEKVKPAEKPPEELSTKAEVEKLKKSIADKDAAYALKIRNEQIKAAIALKKISGEGAIDLEARLVMEHGAIIRTEGEKVYAEVNGSQIPLPQFIEETYLKGSKGDRFKAAPGNGADTGNVAGAQTGADGQRKFFHDLPKDVQDKMFADGSAREYVKADCAAAGIKI